MGMSSNNLRGFGELYCPGCKDVSTISLDLDDCFQFRCLSCEWVGDLTETRAVMKDLQDAATQWQLALNWAETAPLCRMPDPA